MLLFMLLLDTSSPLPDSQFGSGNSQPNALDKLATHGNTEDADIYRRIAFVSGNIGGGPAYVPKVPANQIDSYFVSNNLELVEFAAGFGWIPMHMSNIQVYDSRDGVEYELFNCEASKQLKVFPQLFLLRDYDYIVWFDNRYELLVDEVIQTIQHWNISTAMMLHRRPECCGADLEFTAAMLQPRYVQQRERIETYMNQQIALGYPVHGEMHYQTGFIIYNMLHTDTLTIQNMWRGHINQVGIMCQIAFYFVAQRFTESIREYVPAWKTVRYSFVTYYD